MGLLASNTYVNKQVVLLFYIFKRFIFHYPIFDINIATHFEICSFMFLDIYICIFSTVFNFSCAGV